MKPSRISQLIFSTIGVLLFLIFVQCYTTFKHPPISSYADSTEVYHSREISFIEDCSSCHEQNNPMHDSHLQLYDDPLYQNNSNWQYYYVIPWWVDAYYYEDNVAQQRDALPAPQRRDFDRREMSPSSAVPSAGTPGAGLAKPATGSSASTPATADAPPQQRNERREAVIKERSDSHQSPTTGPERKKREDEKTKKEKE